MEIKLDVDNDFCDEIVAARLLQTYRYLSADIQSNTWGEKDIENFKAVVQALEVVGPWFVYNWDKKKKAKK